MEYKNGSPTASHAISSMFESVFPDDVNRTHSRRLQAYRKYWLYYLGQHWSYARDAGDPTLTLNYSRRLIDLHNDFTFKKGFKVTIPDDPTTPGSDKEDRDFVRVMLEETWRKNNKYLWLMEAGQGGAVTGDVFGRVSWDTTDPLEDPHARVDLIPAQLCFPEFGGPHGVDRKKLKRILIVNPIYKESQNMELVGARAHSRPHSMSEVSMTMEAEEWVAPVYDRRSGKLLKPAMVRFYENKVLIEEKENPLGTIPVVHIPNYPLAGEYFGISDLSDLTELNREMNEKITDISDIINYHGSPTTIISGAKLKDLEKGANRIWALPENAKAYNLALDGDLTAASSHYQELRSAMLELSGTTEQALGKFEGSVPPSGVALQLQYLPMLEKRDIKVLTYGLGIRLINRLILMVTALGDGEFGKKLNALKGNKYRNEVVFPDPLPQDERRELEMTKERLAMGISTRKRELERMGYSQAEITDILEEAKEDALLDAEGLFDLGPGQGSFQLSRGGSDSTRGEKIVQSNIDNFGKDPETAPDKKRKEKDKETAKKKDETEGRR